MRIGLRIDVDTLRGSLKGVPALVRLLDEAGVRASFFFSVGPDNMGRHLWRLLRPAFLVKMLRSNAAGLYGWDILLRGTFWPGPVIARRAGAVIRAAAAAGHEIGFHAWDHHAWQAHIDRMPADRIRKTLTRGVEALTAAAGVVPCCSAVPGWKCTDAALEAKSLFPFRYNSDCRGRSVFRPVVGNRVLTQPQIPVTLPTYDELIGRDGVTIETYNTHLLGLIGSQAAAGAPLSVLTIHAEVEGIVCAALFREFLGALQTAGHAVVPLGDLLSPPDAIPRGIMRPGSIPGREGWVSVQEGSE